MNFGRAKTILIVLFIFVNIFLVSYMFSSSSDNTAPSSKTVENTTKILKERNVFLNEQINLKSYDNISFLNLKSIASDERVLATKLLGEYKIKNGIYESDYGVLAINKGNFVLDYKDDHTFKEFDAESVEKYAKKFLNDKEIDTSSLRSAGVFKEKGNYKVVFKHYFLDKPVFNLETLVFVSGGGVYKVSGNIFSLDSVTPAENTDSPINVLLSYSSSKNKSEKTHISNIVAGYYVDTDPVSSKSLSALPCYQLVLQEGESLYFDATSATAVK